MNFVINDERLFHLLRHFESIDDDCLDILIHNGYTEKNIVDGLKSSGSLFLPSFCFSPCQLSDIFSNLKPVTIKLQENGFYAINYFSKKYLGTNGLIAIDELSKKDQKRIFFQNRDGIKIKVVKEITAPLTKEAHIIAKKESDNDVYDIITCFPGTLSPPFPKYITNEKEKIISEKFWANHVLIEQ